MRNFILLVMFLVVPMSFVIGQEKKEKESEKEDYFAEFDEYSYLWEDDKAKAKTEKKRLKAEKKRLKQLAKQKKNKVVVSDSSKQETKLPTLDSLNTSTIAFDSLQQLSSLGSDSLQFEKAPQVLQELVRDTIPDPVPAPSDTLKLPEVTQDTLNVDLEEKLSPFEKLLIEEDGGKKKKKEKKQRNAVVPENIQDFRAGLGATDSVSTVRGGLTFTQIGDQNFVGLTLSPEFNLGKVGFGLNIPILYGLDDNQFRTDIFRDGIGIGRLITYVRYGVQKRDPVYFKVGQLNNTMIGFGGLVNNYTNSTSFEQRKVGLHFDFNVKGVAGIEGLYSDFDPASLNLLVIRPYARPLAKSGIPIVRTFELGATFLQDKDQTQRVIDNDNTFTNTFTAPGIGAFGIDAGLTLLRVPFVQIDLFANYSRLNVESQVLTDSLNTIMASTDSPAALQDGFENGSGFSVGFNFRLHFILDIFSTDVRIERLGYSEHYLPQFFDTSYEINKDAKILSLASAAKQSGIYGSLTGHILKKVRLGGSLLIPDDVSESSPAIVRVNADVDRLADKISLHGSYIKGDLASLQDAFKLDERSLAKLRFVYHVNQYLAAGLDYYWAFARVGDGSVQATKYFSPYFGLNIDF